MERRKSRRLQTEMARANQVTVQRRAEEARKELEQDMQILEEAIEATRGEAEAVAEEKRRMAKEMQLYKKYMEEVRAYEREREQNIDMFHRAESDKVRRQDQARWSRRCKKRNTPALVCSFRHACLLPACHCLLAALNVLPPSPFVVQPTTGHAAPD